MSEITANAQLVIENPDLAQKVKVLEEQIASIKNSTVSAQIGRVVGKIVDSERRIRNSVSARLRAAKASVTSRIGAAASRIGAARRRITSSTARIMRNGLRVTGGAITKVGHAVSARGVEPTTLQITDAGNP
jgi:cell division septum initiation protein DivIVA